MLNCLIVIVVLLFIFGWPGSSNAGANPMAFSSITSSSTSSVGPLDTLSSSEIAATAAQLAGLPETTAIVNQAESDTASLDMITAGNGVTAKPQVVTSNYYSNKDIRTYIVQAGDTVASVASKFGLNQNSIIWSNPSVGSNLAAGDKLLIPPVNGIVYSVKSGDTPTSLATKYDSNEAQIVAYNDAEISGIKPGELIIIPGGSVPAPASGIDNFDIGGNFAWGGSAIYGENGYDFGECTWYVATQIPVPANWGNAATWAYYASRTPGWQISPVPTVGAIAQTPYSAGGYGHVAIVDAVSPDGTMIQYRDMNGLAGWDRVGYSGWVPTSHFTDYITR